MNVKKLFAALNLKGVQDAEYRYVSVSNFNCGVFRGELTSYGASTTTTINVDAIINNKLAMVSSENTSNNNIDNLVNQLLETAKYTNNTSNLIFKDKARYRHFKYFNKELMNIPSQEKIKLVVETEKKVKALNPNIEEVEVDYSENSVETIYQNTANIKLKNKKNNYSFYAAAVVKNGENKFTEGIVFTDNDLSKYKMDDFVQQLAKRIEKKLNVTSSIETKKHKVVFDPEVVDELLSFYVAQLSAEQILKNSSWFKDKLNTQVANKRVTILETPLKRDQDFTGFDAQGVPCQNRPIIKKGVLLTYLHNLDTAKKFNVAPTGNASVANGKIGIRAHSIHLKPTSLTKDELLAKVKDGLYVTSLEGAHAGMNVENGDFSLKAEGFIIKDGKIDQFVKMMTVSSNLYDIFNNVKAISENIEYIHNGIVAPCIYVDNINVAK